MRTGAVVANLAIAFETTDAVKEKAERDQAERALRKSEARLREALEGIGLSFYALDQDQRFLYASRQALEDLGQEARRFDRRPVSLSIPERCRHAGL